LIATARVAQLVERQAFNLNVQGSSPCSGEFVFIILYNIYGVFSEIHTLEDNFLLAPLTQADGALGEHLTTIWIHFTSWDGFSREITQSIYFKLSSVIFSVIFLKNLDSYFLFLT
jgi:hypothetical protein